MILPTSTKPQQKTLIHDIEIITNCREKTLKENRKEK
jgi:hypothetical protein